MAEQIKDPVVPPSTISTEFGDIGFGINYNNIQIYLTPEHDNGEENPQPVLNGFTEGHLFIEFEGEVTQVDVDKVDKIIFDILFVKNVVITSADDLTDLMVADLEAAGLTVDKTYSVSASEQ